MNLYCSEVNLHDDANGMGMEISFRMLIGWCDVKNSQWVVVEISHRKRMKDKLFKGKKTNYG